MWWQHITISFIEDWGKSKQWEGITIDLLLFDLILKCPFVFS